MVGLTCCFLICVFTICFGFDYLDFVLMFDLHCVFLVSELVCWLRCCGLFWIALILGVVCYCVLCCGFDCLVVFGFFFVELGCCYLFITVGYLFLELGCLGCLGVGVACFGVLGWFGCFDVCCWFECLCWPFVLDVCDFVCFVWIRLLLA